MVYLHIVVDFILDVPINCELEILIIHLESIKAFK